MLLGKWSVKRVSEKPAGLVVEQLEHKYDYYGIIIIIKHEWKTV